MDKSTGGPGPWQDEPDRKDWHHAGFHVFAHRNETLGNWCAYVGVEKDHPYFGKNYDDIPVDVHGWLTYGRACDGKMICHVPCEGESEETWWFGFDCGHSFDTSPGTIGLYKQAGIDSIFRGATYKTLSYVENETNKLAQQLRDIMEDKTHV